MALLYPAGYQFGDSNLDPVGAGSLYVYNNGTTVKATIYTDPALSVEASNPIVLDSAGRMTINIYVANNTAYTLTLDDSDDAEVWSRDDSWGITKVPNVNLAGLIDHTDWSVWFDDFHRYDPDEWVVTEVGASGTQALQINGDLENGVLRLVNGSSNNNSIFMQWKGDIAGASVTEPWGFDAGKRLIFKCRISMGDVLATSMHVGLGISDTTPGIGGSEFSDCVVFSVNDTQASGAVSLRVRKNATNTVTNVGTMADDTFIELMFYYDENGVLSYYVDGVLGGTSSTANLPDDEKLSVSFGVQNGEADLNTLFIDYIYVAVER